MVSTIGNLIPIQQVQLKFKTRSMAMETMLQRMIDQEDGDGDMVMATTKVIITAIVMVPIDMVAGEHKCFSILFKKI